MMKKEVYIYFKILSRFPGNDEAELRNILKNNNIILNVGVCCPQE